LHQVPRIAGAQQLGQRNQRGSVIDGIDFAQLTAGQIEDIAMENIDVRSAVPGELADGRGMGRDSKPGEQLLDGDLAQFGADHALTAGQKPIYVERLATQRDEYATARPQGQTVEMRKQQRIGLGFVETDLVSLPLVMPE
jgi:hypothetical protein